MKRNIYVLGTGTSHDGSACLLKNGKICVAIEKERITRIKHDGGNDRAAIEYCLKAENIKIHDLDLVVQNANFGFFKFGNDFFNGPRPFNDEVTVPIVTISHHLAHAYSTIGSCSFDKFNILVMDGCGNSYDDCIDIAGAFVPDLPRIRDLPHVFYEKDSYYHSENGRCISLIKDFSEGGYGSKRYPMHPNTTKHSIGGLYGSASLYCFGDVGDVGKLMGLGPYGKPGVFKDQIFELKDGRVFLNYDWMQGYRRPARSFEDFKNNFQYYADIAYGIQQEIERAVLYIFKSRLEAFPTEDICYSGGTALNAVANAKILQLPGIERIYIQPAAGDNGLALGCAYYGWLEVLQKEKINPNGNTCFGITYSTQTVKTELESYVGPSHIVKMKETMDVFFKDLNDRRNIAGDTRALIQFNIKDFGVFQVLLNKQITSGNQLFGNPSCIVNANGFDFYEAITHPGKANELIAAKKIEVSNIRDLGILLKNINFDDFLQKIKQPGTIALTNKQNDFEYEYCEDYISRTAGLIAQGKTVGWFQDGCEFGPRALGRRSILADPRNPSMRTFINSEIKFREDFRPFAPSVLLEDVSIFFESDRESPYMILVDYIKEPYKNHLKSVVHENGTCRVQTVTPEWNPKYYELLQEFKKISGIPVVLNTSFNRRGMPIVETPREALEFFLSCKLDYLVIDKYLVSKPH